MKYLYIFRHADTLSAQSGQSDHERVLSELGEAECTRIGLFLKEENLQPEYALCSTAVRTRTTLGLVAKTLDTPIEAQFEHALYLASPGEIFHQLNGLENTIEAAMVVGHNPGIHQFCMMLASKGNAEGLSALAMNFPPASLALFKVDIEDWNLLSPETAGELIGLVFPSQ
ncbi:MAG: histidine phosphatase family protein [Alphaproteobacteria bacterium]|nr:histidine phosphatase family protein [Alphaproteobacteria bacterium]